MAESGRNPDLRDHDHQEANARTMPNPSPPLVSILINSYNYERFVARTIDSALAQTHRPLEVIVVDDGSTDASWAVIESYGDRIQAVRTANGGQGSAYNEGFARSRGEWVLFLDSDDLLDPGAIARCLAAATADVSHVQFRLRLIDPDDRPIGGSIPYRMHSGDVRPIIERFGIYAGPPGSANFYRRSGIAHAFPLDTRHWRRAGADTAPFVASGLTGSIASIDEEWGSYRLHVSSNASAGVFGNISKSHRAVLEVEQSLMAAMLEMFGTRMTTRTAATLLPTPSNLRIRALSWKHHRADHLHPGDSAWGLLDLARQSLRHWPGYRTPERLMLMTWFALVLLLPAAASERVARWVGSGAAKARVRKLMGLVRVGRRSSST